MTDFRTTNHSRFTAYEYTKVRVAAEHESLYRDTYANFGWELDGRQAALKGSDTVTLNFKRDRGIENRAAVADLQRSCDRALEAIVKAERSVSSTAAAAAAFFGVVGAGLLAGSIFALDADLTILSIALGANGLFAWIAGYFAHGRVSTKQAATIAPSIDNQYQIVLKTGERASTLLRRPSSSQRAVTL